MIIPAGPKRLLSLCDIYSSHIVISCVFGFVSRFSISLAPEQPLVAPGAGVLCLQLIHLLHSQLELLVLALLV